jgi:hypothetical protein
VADALRDYLRGKPAGKPVWPGKWKSRAFLLMQADLHSARQAWLQSFRDARQRADAGQSDFLTYCDAQGRYADFHALRHSFITMVGKAGVSPKEHQDLARHSTYSLTSRYTHARFYDLAAAVQALPIPTAPAGPEVLSATGTDGRTVLPENPSKILGPFLGPSGEILGNFVRQAETDEGGFPQTENPGEQRISATIQGFQRATAKMEDRGFEPLTS